MGAVFSKNVDVNEAVSTPAKTTYADVVKGPKVVQEEKDAKEYQFVERVAASKKNNEQSK